MSKSKVLSTAQKKLAIDYLISESSGELSATDWERFYSKRPSAERLIIYERAKLWARNKPASSPPDPVPKPPSQPYHPDSASLPSPQPSYSDAEGSPVAAALKVHQPTSKKPFLAHLTLSQHEMLKQLSSKTGESQAHHVRQALTQYLDRFFPHD